MNLHSLLPTTAIGLAGLALQMDKALRGAKKSSQLIVYPKLEHSLVEGDVRADLLRRSDAFLRSALKLPAQ